MRIVLSALVIVSFCSNLLAGDGYAVTTPGKAGTGGLVPVLAGTGPAAPGSLNSLALSDALPNSSVVLVAGFSELAAPLKGGILGPNPDIMLAGLPANGLGELVIPFAMPVNAPPGLMFWIQIWVTDPGASFGLSASNTLKLTVQQSLPVGLLFPGVKYTVGFLPQSVVIEDLNGDGVPDLVVANFNSNDVSVLLGAGDGSFGTAVSFGAGSDPYSVAIEDLNGDGVPDLVVANSGSGDVSVLLNQLCN